MAGSKEIERSLLLHDLRDLSILSLQRSTRAGSTLPQKAESPKSLNTFSASTDSLGE